MAGAEANEFEPTTLQRRLFLSFCATALAGVLLCVVYLSGRSSASPPIIPAPALRSIPDPPAPPKPVASNADPIPGKTYLQLAALDRRMADTFVKVVRKKGFPAIVAKGPTESIFRVLVGPMEDAATLARTQADLQALGYKSFPRKQ